MNAFKVYSLILILVFLSFICEAGGFSTNDSPVQPQGGMTQLFQFINNNLKVPLLNEKFVGQVLLRLVVEADSSVSNIEVVKSLDTVYDKEAIRVLSLFKAWVPARDNNGTIKQNIEISVDFPKNNIYTEFRDSSTITYYDAFLQNVSNKSDAILYSVSSVNNKGIPNTDISFFKMGEKKVPVIILKLEQTIIERNTPIFGDIIADTLTRYKQISFKNKAGKIEGDVYRLYPDGSIFEHLTYKNGKQIGVSKKYYVNGMLAEERSFPDDNTTDFRYFRWYTNGQIAENSTYSTNGDDNFKMSYVLYNMWDDKGNFLIKEGNGNVKIEKYNTSQDILIEQGEVTQGLKNGLWEGFVNNMLAFQEIYSSGELATAGYVDESGHLKDYKKRFNPPQYKNGDNQIVNFITQKIKSDTDIEEKLHFTFLVQKDGTLSNISLDSSSKNSYFQKNMISIFLKTNGNWKPATYFGRPVLSQHDIFINISVR